MSLTPLHIKIGKYALLSSAILLAMSASFFSGITQGENNISAQWQKEKAETAQKLLILTGKIQHQEFVHRQETVRIAEQLRKTEAEHEETVAALNAERAHRLRLSTERAAAYQRLAEAGSDKCRGLASHAAQLDRSLEEGRSLVGELTAALRQRDDQLRLLGAQINNDRQLLDGQK